MHAVAHLLGCAGACAGDDLPGDGFMLAGDTGGGHTAGSVEYTVFAPTAGVYDIAYRARADADAGNPAPAIQVSVGSPSCCRPPPKPTP